MVNSIGSYFNSLKAPIWELGFSERYSSKQGAVEPRRHLGEHNIL